MSGAHSPQNGSGSMFDRIAPRYDLLNRLMSLGLDQSWRRRQVRSLALQGPTRVLDLATGTADVALAIARYYPQVVVTGVDPSANMLAIGDRKARAAGLHERIHLQQGDAQALPFADATFAATCMSFGIRNVPNRAAALAEMARVTQPGGRVLILELNEPETGLFAPLARFYVHLVVPMLGGLIGGGPEYLYLQRSIAAFPRASEFRGQLQQAGLEVLTTERLGFGAASLFIARVPLASTLA